MPPEVLDTAAPAQEAPSLRDTLNAAIEANPITAPAPDRETPQQTQNNPAETVRQSVERARRPDGKFAPKITAPEGSTVPSDDEVRAASEPVTTETPHEETEAAQGPSIDNAPKSWKAGPREKWVNLDPDIRTEIHRREREAARAIGDAAPARKFAQTFQEVIGPHGQRYAGSGLSPLQVVSNLMEADQVLSTAPMAQRAAFMAKMIQDYQIDIRILDSALAGEDPSSEPLAVVEELINRKMQPLQEFVQTTQQGRQQALQREYSQQQAKINAMFEDDQNYPHMQLVANDMADIIEMNQRRKVYLSPEEAYKRAVAMNPDAQAAEQGRTGQQRARVAHDAATRSLGASLSVSGSPAGLKQTVAPNDLRGTIEAAWAQAQGR